MKIAFMSITGNVKSFISKLDLTNIELIEIDDQIEPENLNGEDYLLIIPTYDEFMTECIDDFIDTNKNSNCLGIIGSGNRNFGDDGYIFTAKNLSKKYNIPILLDFEYAGLDSDIEKTNIIIKQLKENT